MNSHIQNGIGTLAYLFAPTMALVKRHSSIFLRIFSFVLILGQMTALSTLSVAADSASSSYGAQSNPVLDGAALVESPIAKVYRARALLEDHRNWTEAFELLRDVLANTNDLDPVVERKIKQASSEIAFYLPTSWARWAFNKRKLMRPFLKASLLLNEALMDWRMRLNQSNDTEVLFVEQLLESYFFPGAQDVGTIEFPARASYSFELFALTPENLLKAKQHTSTDSLSGFLSGEEDSKADQDDSETDRKPRLKRESNALRPEDRPARLSFERTERPSGVSQIPSSTQLQISSTGGFVKEALDEGVTLQEITDEAISLIKKLKLRDRVQNNYLETSMIVQAIVDPSSVLFDPQLRAFLEGVRVKAALGETEALNDAGIASLKNILGPESVQQNSNGIRISLDKLLKDQENSPFHKSSLEIEVAQVDGTGRSVLYVISSIAGPDLMRLRTLQAASSLVHNATTIEKIATNPLVLNGVKLGYVGLQKLLTVLPSAVAFLNTTAANAKFTSAAITVKGLAKGLEVGVGLQKLGVKIAKYAGPKTSKLYNAIKSNKFVQNGGVLAVLTVVTAATQLSVGAIQYHHADSEDEKREIYVETLSQTGGTLTYALPYVGWACAAVDIAHHTMAFPVETADLFRGFNWSVEAAMYKYLGTSHTEIAVSPLENRLSIPRDLHWFKRAAYVSDEPGSEHTVDQALINLLSEVQDTALSQLTLLYVANRTFASSTQRGFGERIMTYIDEYRKAMDYSRELESHLLSLQR